MFLHLSASHSVHRSGEGVSKPTPREKLGGYGWGGGLQASPREELGGYGWGGGLQASPREELGGYGWGGGLQAHTQGGALGSGQGGLQAHTRGGGIQAKAMGGGGQSQYALRQTHPPPPPADGYCCGQYASYWNAFLFSYKIKNI